MPWGNGPIGGPDFVAMTRDASPWRPLTSSSVPPCSGRPTPGLARASGELGVDCRRDDFARSAQDRFIPLGPAQDERSLESDQELGGQVERPLVGDAGAGEGIGDEMRAMPSEWAEERHRLF